MLHVIRKDLGEIKKDILGVWSGTPAVAFMDLLYVWELFAIKSTEDINLSVKRN